MSDSMPLTETLNCVEEEINGSTVTLGEIMESLNSRGFGPLLMVPALIVLMPTGAIPGVPGICGLFLCLVAGQILAGMHSPWLPKRLKKISIKRKKLISSIDKIRPYVEKIDGYTHRRFDFFTGRIMQRIVALLCLMLSLVMIIIGFIPFLPMVIAIPILIFACGLTARDGVLMFISILFTFAVFVLVLWLAGAMDPPGAIPDNKQPVLFSKPLRYITLNE